MGPLIEKLLLRPRLLRVLMLVLAAQILLLLNLLWGGAISQWDERICSFAWGFANPALQERRVVIVDVDEKSVQALGNWPWSRERMAELLTRLDSQGVALKLLDVLFEGDREGTQALKQALQNGSAPSVVAEVLALDSDHPLRSGQLTGALAFANCPEVAWRGYGFLAPQQGLLPAGAFAGHISPLLEPDGAIRRVPALVCEDNRTYAVLPVAGLLAAGVADTPRLLPGHGLIDPAWWLTVGDFRLPLDERGLFRVC